MALGVLILVVITASLPIGAWFLLTTWLGDPAHTYAQLEESLALFAVPSGFEMIAEERRGTPGGFAASAYPNVARVYVTIEPTDAACSQALAAFELFATEIARIGEPCSFRGDIAPRTAEIRVVEGPDYGHELHISGLARERPTEVAVLLRVTDPDG